MGFCVYIGCLEWPWDLEGVSEVLGHDMLEGQIVFFLSDKVR